MKLEMHMGVISPFTQEIIGAGLVLGGHLTTPLEMTIARKVNKVALDIKIPAEIQRETSLFHAFVTPFTVKKNLRVLAPISKAASLKPVVSGLPLKKINMNVGAPLDIDARVEICTPTWKRLGNITPSPWYTLQSYLPPSEEAPSE